MKILAALVAVVLAVGCTRVVERLEAASFAGCAVDGGPRDAGPESDAHADAAPDGAAPDAGPTSLELARARLNHLVFIIQENRSFDHYFGTYPGANGLPPTTCIPNPRSPGGCAHPYHDALVNNPDTPHERANSLACINSGAMNGFCTNAEASQTGCCDGTDPCRTAIDVMSYHNRSELPNYWAYADSWVLQDSFFPAVSGASLASHKFIFGAWAAKCTTPDVPSSCTTDVTFNADPATQILAQTDLTWLLHAYGVSWKVYGAAVGVNTWPHCSAANSECPPTCPGGVPTSSQTRWLPLDNDNDVSDDGEVPKANATLNQFFIDVHAGTLPAVSWIIPGECWSEHPPRNITLGEKYVTGLINTIGHSSSWGSTAVFLTWDDWGGILRPRRAADGRRERVRRPNPGARLIPFRQNFHRP